MSAHARSSKRDEARLNAFLGHVIKSRGVLGTVTWGIRGNSVYRGCMAIILVFDVVLIVALCRNYRKMSHTTPAFHDRRLLIDLPELRPTLKRKLEQEDKDAVKKRLEFNPEIMDDNAMFEK